MAGGGGHHRDRPAAAGEEDVGQSDLQQLAGRVSPSRCPPTATASWIEMADRPARRSGPRAAGRVGRALSTAVFPAASALTRAASRARTDVFQGPIDQHAAQWLGYPAGPAGALGERQRHVAGRHSRRRSRRLGQLSSAATRPQLKSGPSHRRLPRVGGEGVEAPPAH